MTTRKLHTTRVPHEAIQTTIVRLGMKKRTREISVDGRGYVWLVVEDHWPNRVLKIWKAEQPRRIWIEERDEDVEHPITPAVVADVIRKRFAEE